MAQESSINNKYSWLTAGKTFQSNHSEVKVDNSILETEKEKDEDGNMSLSSDNVDVVNLLNQKENETNDKLLDKLKPFSFKEYNNLKSKKKKQKYIRKYYMQKIFIDNDPNSLSFTFNPLEDKNYFTYKMIQLKEIPQYNRLNTYQIIGIKNMRISKAILYDLNQIINQHNISKREIEESQQEEEGNEIYFLRKKRYYSQCLPYGQINYENTLRETEIINQLKQDEGNPRKWIDYIKANLHKERERLNKIMIDKLVKIEFTQECLPLSVFQLRYYSEISLSPPNLSLFALKVIKRKEFECKSDRFLFLIEYLDYMKKQSQLSIVSIRDIYLVLCQLFQFTEDTYLYIVFDLIHFEWKREKYYNGMSILLSLIEVSLLHLKSISCLDYEEYFNSNYPKIGELLEGTGYIHYKARTLTASPELFNRDDHIDKYISTSDSSITYRKANHSFNSVDSSYDDIVLYSDICDYIFPIKAISSFIEKLFALISSEDTTALNSLCSYTRKYMIDINSQLYEYIVRLCSFIRENNINHNDSIDHFLLNVIFSNKNLNLDHKLLKAKELFKREANQNNIPLYYSYMFWLLYYGKVLVSDLIIKHLLIKKKQSKEEEAQVNLINLQYSTIKAVTGLIPLINLDPNIPYGNLTNYITLLFKWENNQTIIDYISNSKPPDLTDSIYYAMLIFELNSIKYSFSFNQSEAFYISLDKIIKDSSNHIDYLILLIFKRNYIRFLKKFSYDINYIKYLPRLDYWDALVILSKELLTNPTVSSLTAHYIKYDNIVNNNYLSFNLIPYSLYALSYEYYLTSFIDNCNQSPLFNDLFQMLFKRIPFNTKLRKRAQKFLK